MGMTPGQILLRVELPLAAPVILTGARISLVIGVGTAAIAIFGVVVLGERIDPLKILALTMIIGGVVVLNLHTAH